MFYFACVHNTIYAPSAKPNCGLITHLCRQTQKQASRSCTNFRCALCQNVDAPVPGQIWQSSWEGESCWLNSAWPIPASWREKSQSWNSLDQSLVPFERTVLLHQQELQGWSGEVQQGRVQAAWSQWSLLALQSIGPGKGHQFSSFSCQTVTSLYCRSGISVWSDKERCWIIYQWRWRFLSIP